MARTRERKQYYRDWCDRNRNHLREYGREYQRKVAAKKRIERDNIKQRLIESSVKVCRECKTEKSKDEFHKRPDNFDGLRNDCKACHQARGSKRYSANKSRHLAQCKQWRVKNAKSLTAYERRRTKTPEYRARAARTYQNNRLRIVARRKARRHNDPNYRILTNLRSRLRLCLKRSSGKKAKGTILLLGCSIADFVIYLESKFEPGMSWRNYGEWEIDHIMPCAIFDLTKPRHQKRCFHFSNMQPLWASENSSKCAKVLDEQFRLI